jgi:hypothetical protein
MSIRDSEVVLRHQEAVRRLQDLVQTLIGRAEAMLSSPNPLDQLPAAKKSGGNAWSERDSACDVVVKLSGVLTKLIALEREAHDLDVRIDPKDLSDEQIIRLLKRATGAGGRETRA